jgi:uncharacterized membrane protein
VTASGSEAALGVGPSTYSRDRTIALSDGVFSIAITLLVLEIVPHIADTVTGRDFVSALLDMAPALVAYFLSFLVIGRFWDSHRIFFRFINRADARVVWANLAVLLWITLIPATAALLGSHWEEPVALALYAVNLLFVIGSLWVLWRLASSGGHLSQDGLHTRAGQYIDRYAAMSSVGFALAIPAAYLSPPVALLLVFLTTAVARTLARRSLIRAATTEDGGAAVLRGHEADGVDEEI